MHKVVVGLDEDADDGGRPVVTQGPVQIVEGIFGVGDRRAVGSAEVFVDATRGMRPCDGRGAVDAPGAYERIGEVVTCRRRRRA